MANILPTDLFTGLTSDGSSITIPLSALAGLTAAEADPATGDGREVARVLMDTIYSKINALATANRPSKMSITKSNPVGIGLDQVRQGYTASFDIGYTSSGASLVAEA